jgi:UDP-GlcNAc:undecaprenyl-phosphate GlcNAc-1-phosphate transferase
MGDAGSNFLGYSLAVVSIMGMVKVAAVFSMLVPIVILAIPIFDTGFAIVRRLIQGKSIFEPDNSHLHHRIAKLGFSHRQTVLIILLINTILGVIAVSSAVIPKNVSWMLLIIVGSLLLAAAWKIGIIKVEKKSQDCK